MTGLVCFGDTIHLIIISLSLDSKQELAPIRPWDENTKPKRLCRFVLRYKSRSPFRVINKRRQQFIVIILFRARNGWMTYEDEGAYSLYKGVYDRDDVRRTAFYSHANCYIQSGGFCNLPPNFS